MKNQILSEKIVYRLSDISAVAEKLCSLKNQVMVFTFTGPLGAGKTTLITHMLQLLGVTDIITSPTFAYVNQYKNAHNETFYHFDLYRLATLHDFIGAGFTEYLYQPYSWVFIEWPTIIEPLLDRKVCHIGIDYINENTRELTYTIIP